MDFWEGAGDTEPMRFTTIGNWHQPWRDVQFDGEVYHWTKDLEFRKVLDLPSLTEQTFELALSSIEEADRRMLQSKGWKVSDGLTVSREPESYRNFIVNSRGEFTVAKDQNVRLKTGWFSERSATYLAAGRPVITQDTGFGSAIPAGEGLFGFADVEEARSAIEAVNANYGRHRRAAYELGRDYFNYDVVLPRLLEHAGVETSRHAARSGVSK